MADYYHDILLPEVVRYAKIRSMDPESLDEYGAAIFATWYTQNPLRCPDRDNICNFDETDKPDKTYKTDKPLLRNKSAVKAHADPQPPDHCARKRKGTLFTAHTHPNEPLTPSPDDLAVCKRFETLLSRTDTPAGTASRAEDELLNFIIDGYTCRKVEKSQK